MIAAIVTGLIVVGAAIAVVAVIGLMLFATLADDLDGLFAKTIDFDFALDEDAPPRPEAEPSTRDRRAESRPPTA